MLQIPENYTEFLYWLKEKTETFWSKDPRTATDEFACDEWIYGAKWVPLKDEEIDAVEKKYGVQFMPEHRAFLKILHAIDKKEIVVHQSFNEGDASTIEIKPFFYNWLEDEVAIRSQLEWPYRTILKDVLGRNGTWLQSWGKRPASEEERTRIFTDWLNKAPRLIPLTGHRFLVSEPHLTDRPVLSVWGSDIMVYGWNIRLYLLNELWSELDLQKMEEVELNSHFDTSYANAPEKDIPYWKEMILFWSSGWGSFGMKSPTDNGETVQSIKRTYKPEDGEDDQKRFNNF